MLKVSVDFNTEDQRGWIDINTDVYPDLLELLRPDLPLLLSEPGLEVEAVAVYDAAFKRWYGIPDWSTSRDT
jgi:hypothetical protein